MSKKIIMKRNEVYALIDGERDYQQELIAKNNWTDPKRVGEFLSILRVCLAKAENEWYSESDQNPSNTLSQIRKIAAVSVACMETHNTPPRG